MDLPMYEPKVLHTAVPSSMATTHPSDGRLLRSVTFPSAIIL